ncbi:MAG TPA: hypothetical protein QGF58_28205 [Myxococcota bacterium]|nr:hypothetical protein [Myxococcota bacterium]
MNRLVAVAITSALLTACAPGNRVGADLAEVLPDDRIQVNLRTDSELAKDAEDGIWSNAYLFTARVTDDVNAMIAFPLILVDVITSTPPSEIAEDGNSATWGPYGDALDPVETILYVDHDVELDTYTWSFLQKPKGADDSEYVPIVLGEVDSGATREVHSGRFTVDFTTADNLDPNVRATGTFTSEYDVQEDTVSAQAIFIDFQGERGGDPVDAVYSYDQTPDGAGQMDLGWFDDVNEDGEDDIWVVRSRWTSEGAGRADSVIAAGGSEVSYAASECWDGSFDPVYQVNSWAGDLMGAEADCAFAETSYPEE